MRRARRSGVRFTVRLKEEDLEAVDRLCAMWGLSRVGTLRRAVLQAAVEAGDSEGRTGEVVGGAQGVVPRPDIEERLAALEARLQAEWEHRLRKLDDKIDYLSLLLDERTATRTNWAESFAEYEGRRDIGADEDGKAEPLVEVTPEAPAKEPRRYARRPGQGRPLAPVREILAGEHVEIDVSGQ